MIVRKTIADRLPASHRCHPMKYATSKLLLPPLIIVMSMIAFTWADAAPPKTFHLTIENQSFEPNSVTIPAEQTIKILVINKDSIPAEFESSKFNAEVVIPGKSHVPVYIRPLEPGTYEFFNDFHPQSKGKLIVTPSGQ